MDAAREERQKETGIAVDVVREQVASVEQRMQDVATRATIASPSSTLRCIRGAWRS